MIKQGFYVKTDGYVGPFDKLSEARTEARKIGKDIPIYHGVLGEDDKFEGELVPKVKK